MIEDNLHGEQYKARKGELVAAHEEYNKAMKDKEEKGKTILFLVDKGVTFQVGSETFSTLWNVWNM